MYSTERANSITSKDVSFLPAGIHENVELLSAKVETSIQGNTFLEIKFHKNGMGLTQTEWEPTKRSEDISDISLQDKCDKQFKRMLQILECFYTKEQLVFTGANFKEFAAWVVNMLNAADKSVKLKLKVVYNNKGYTTLPAYSTYTFIEKMDLEDGKTSKIIELTIDKFVRPVIADVEKPNTNFLQTQYMASTGLTNPSGLPFQ